MPILCGGSTTLRQRNKRIGLEPDDSFWIANAERIRCKTTIDLKIDPPPDLALEIDIPRNTLNRMRNYAAIGVREVWRYDRRGLSFHVLNCKGKYESRASSATFGTVVTPDELATFLTKSGEMDQNEIIRQFREWIRARIAA